MSTVAKRRPITDALLVMLRARTLPGGATLDIGDAHAPTITDSDAVPDLPYAIVYDTSSVLTGTYGQPHADGRFTFQITSVGANRRQAATLADYIRDSILDIGPAGYVYPISVSGAAVMARELEVGGPATQHGDLWNVVDYFALTTTPSI